jgi:Protein of unknown function (DUF2752)
MRLRAIAALALVAAAVLPDRAVHGMPTLCWFRRIVGIPCPSCGLTRSWQATAHGRLRDGFRFHPYGPLTLAAALWLMLDGAAEGRLASTSPRTRSIAVLAWFATWGWRLSRRR